MNIRNRGWAASLILAVASCLTLVVGRAEADPAETIRPIQLSLLAPVQLFPDDTSITGLRLGLFYGRNADVTGVDIGAGLSQATGDMTGVQLGGANLTEGRVDGVQLGLVSSAGDTRGVQLGGANISLGDARGVGLGATNFVYGDFSGWQSGFLNAADGDVRGLQLGFINQMGHAVGVQLGVSDEAESITGLQLGGLNHVGEATGLQLGAINVAEEIEGGVQLGVVNVTREMKGIQIGLINVIEKGGWVMVLPLVNGSF